MKNRIAIILMTIITTFVVTYIVIVQPWGSYSGSRYVLQENGVVTMTDGVLYYNPNDQDGLLSSEELKSLARLSDHYFIVIDYTGELDGGFK